MGLSGVGGFFKNRGEWGQGWMGGSRHRASIQAEAKVECRKRRGGGRGWAEMSCGPGAGWEAESSGHPRAVQVTPGEPVQEAWRDRQGGGRGVLQGLEYA